MGTPAAAPAEKAKEIYGTLIAIQRGMSKDTATEFISFRIDPAVHQQMLAHKRETGVPLRYQITTALQRYLADVGKWPTAEDAMQPRFIRKHAGGSGK